MNIQLNGLITPTSIVFIDLTGLPYTVSSTHPNFELIKYKFKYIKQILNSSTVVLESFIVNQFKELVDLTDIAQSIVKQSDGRVTVKDAEVWYAGQPIHSTITNRILQGLKEGFDMKPYILFLENLMKNPSEVAKNELYDFMEFGKMGITEDGYLLGYKKVRNDYTDVYSGRFDNHPGQSYSMDRAKVDPDRERTCSYGFHFCSYDYLSQFGGSRVMLVKVNPADVVAVPADYKNTKARTCAYTVLSEFVDYKENNVLTEKTVYTDEHLENINVPDWAELDAVEQEEEFLDEIEIYNFPHLDDNVELVEYFNDSTGKTIKVKVYMNDEDPIYTEDPEMIEALFESFKTRAKLLDEKIKVKIYN